MRPFLVWLPALLALHCNPSHSSPPQSALDTQHAPVPWRGAIAPVPSSGPVARPELQAYFVAERVSGSIALLDTRKGYVECSDVARCQTAYLPASTFKIANAIIALETGVVRDAETVCPWNHELHPVSEWNRDNTLRSAMQVSCVPCFQAIARDIGTTRMQHWLTQLDYGNRDISGDIDRFWLDGGLRITPIHQLTFLARLAGGELPISLHTWNTLRDILTLETGPTRVLRGKTGIIQPTPEGGLAAWFVGWVEAEKGLLFFSTIIDSHETEVQIMPVRRRLTETVLAALGW